MLYSSPMNSKRLLRTRDARRRFRVLVALRCPLCVLGLDPAELRNRKKNLVIVHNSPADIARKALRHFAEAGRYASFAYVHNRTRIGWSTLREQAFAKRAPCAIHVLPPTETAEDRQKIAVFLRRLERPAAVLAARTPARRTSSRRRRN